MRIARLLGTRKTALEVPACDRFFGEVRVAQLLSVVICPERFRTRQQFWSYCGLGVVMRSSSDWVMTAEGKWARAQVQRTRGLNFNHNHTLKWVFKGAATSVITQHRDGSNLFGASG